MNQSACYRKWYGNKYKNNLTFRKDRYQWCDELSEKKESGFVTGWNLKKAKQNRIFYSKFESLKVHKRFPVHHSNIWLFSEKFYEYSHQFLGNTQSMSNFVSYIIMSSKNASK